jgi:hypothetical protein
MENGKGKRMTGNGMIRIRMTEPQASAVECRDWSEEPIMAAAWDGDRTLEFAATSGHDLFSELTEASNAEDAFAEMTEHDKEMRKWAARASRALGNLASKVLDRTTESE